MPVANTEPDEIAHFDHLAKLWWDPHGKMGQLHRINPLRSRFILERTPGPAPRVLDVGCGGGILTESLSRAGALVTGIDMAVLPLDIARRHAATAGLTIDYRLTGAEQLASQLPGHFDAVTCLEMLEHVPHPERIVAACATLLKPGGRAFFSTINRTPKAFLFAILIGEYVLGLLPRGTHHYRKLIRPAELRAWASSAGLTFTDVASLKYNPLSRRFRRVDGCVDINYLVCCEKRGT